MHGESSLAGNYQNMLYYLSGGDLAKYPIIKQSNAVETYFNLYLKRLEQLNKNLSTLKEIEYAKRK